jgi:hypothetical protein
MEKMKMKKLKILCALTIMAALTTSIYASWWVDATGFGFCGKGDVQKALGWNNKQLQTNANSLVFTYQDQVTWAIPCKKDNAHDTMFKTFDRKRAINATVAYDPRVKTQVTGFNLNGWSGEPEISGGGPVECPGGWDSDGEPYPVEGSSEGGLYVNGVQVISQVDPL